MQPEEIERARRVTKLHVISYFLSNFCAIKSHQPSLSFRSLCAAQTANLRRDHQLCRYVRQIAVQENKHQANCTDQEPLIAR